MEPYNRDIFMYAVKCTIDSHGVHHHKDSYTGIKMSQSGRPKLYVVSTKPYLHTKHTNMKSIIVRFVMIAAWVAGAGFSYQAFAYKTYLMLIWSMPLAAIGLAYFAINIIWSERKHNLQKVI